MQKNLMICRLAINDQTRKNKPQFLNITNMHKYKIGSLVELIDCRDSNFDRIRLYIIGHIQDCDGSPLYALGTKGLELYQDKDKRFYNVKALTGIAEGNIIPINKPLAQYYIEYNSKQGQFHVDTDLKPINESEAIDWYILNKDRPLTERQEMDFFNTIAKDRPYDFSVEGIKVVFNKFADEKGVKKNV